MKKLVLLNHSRLDGPNGTIGPIGLELAKRQGQIVSDRGIGYNMLFYAPYLESAQTALAFCDGLDHMPNTQPVTVGLDYSTLLAEIDLNGFKSAVKTGLSDFQAIIKVHGQEKTVQWADRARSTVIFMFDQIEHGQTAVGFFHSPIIELAAWSCGVKASILNWDRLEPLKGLIFSFESRTKILVNQRADQEPGRGCVI